MLNNDDDNCPYDAFLPQKQENKNLARFRSIAGNLTSTQLRQLADLADKYGRGYIHLTTRQGVEIPWVDKNLSVAMSNEINRLDLYPGAHGPSIRTVVACPGNEICKHGVMDSRVMAFKLDRAFFDRPVPHKIKMAVSGCPNSCAKPQENDIGLMGIIKPQLSHEKCTGCGLCQRVCVNRAISMVEGKPVITKAKCLQDGKCIAVCPVGAWETEKKGYAIYIGGKIGRQPRLGVVAAEFVAENEVIPMVEKVIGVFETMRCEGERISNTLARIGLAEFQKEMQK